MPKAEKTASISVKLPPELLEKARQKSESTGVPISFVVRKALEEWTAELSKNKKTN
jgi:predicted DNA-binding protein